MVLKAPITDQPAKRSTLKRHPLGLQVISDLLKPERSNLTIKEDKKRGVFVDGLSEWVVRSPQEVMPPADLAPHSSSGPKRGPQSTIDISHRWSARIQPRPLCLQRVA